MMVIEPVLGQQIMTPEDPGGFGQIAAQPIYVRRAGATPQQTAAAAREREERIEAEYARLVTAEPTTPLAVEARERVTAYRAETKFQSDRRRFEAQLRTLSTAVNRKMTDLIKAYNSYEAIPGYSAFAAGRATVRDLIPLMEKAHQEWVKRGEEKRQAWRAELEARDVVVRQEIEAERAAKAALLEQKRAAAVEARVLQREQAAAAKAIVLEQKQAATAAIVLERKQAADAFRASTIAPDWRERAEAAVTFYSRPTKRIMTESQYKAFLKTVTKTAFTYWKRVRDPFVKRGGVVSKIPSEMTVRVYLDRMLREGVTIKPSAADLEKERRRVARAERDAKARAEYAAHTPQPGSPPVSAAIAEVAARYGITPGEMDPAIYETFRSFVVTRAKQLNGKYYYYKAGTAGKKYRYRTDETSVTSILTSAGYTPGPAYGRPAAIQPTVSRPTVIQPAILPEAYTASPEDPMIKQAVEEVVLESGMQSGQEVRNIVAFQRLVAAKTRQLAPAAGRQARPADITAAVDARLRFILDGIAI